MSWKDTIKKEEAPSEAPKSWKDTIQKETALADAPAESDTPIKDMAEQAMDGAVTTAGAGTGGLVGYGAGKLANAGIDKVVTKIGSLTPEQQKYITENATAYKNAPAVSQKFNEYSELGQDVRNRGFDAAKEARLTLKNATGTIPTEEIYKRLAIPTKERIIPRTDLEEVKSQLHETRMSEVRPVIDSQVEASKGLEAKVAELQGQKYVSPQEAKIAELEQLLAAPKANVPALAREKAQSTLQDRRLQRVNEDLALNPDSRKINNRKEDMLLSRKVNQEKTGAIKSFQDRAKLEAMTKELAELKALKETGTAKAVAKQQDKIEKMLKNKTAIDLDVESKTKSAKASADADFNKMLRTPEEIRNTDPKFFSSGILPEEFAKEADLTVKDIRDLGKEASPATLDALMQRTRNRANYDTTVGQTETQKFAKSQAESLRDLVGEQDKNYDKLMKEASGAIDTEAKLLDPKIGGLHLNENIQVPGREHKGKIQFPESSRQGVAGMLVADGKNKFVDEQKEFKAMLNELPIQDQEKYFNDMKTSALKEAVKDTDILRMTGYDAAKAVQGSPASMAKPLWDAKRTRLQEGVAQSKGLPDGILNPATKMGKAIGNILPWGLAAVGTGVGLATAADEFDSPAEMGAVGAADALMPPGTDAIEGYVGAKKATKSALEAGANPMIETIDDPTSLTGQRQGTSFSDDALLAGAKGALSPIPNLVGLAKDGMESFGTSQSNEARLRMQKQMDSLNALKPKPEPKKNGNEFLNFVDKNPQALNELADQLTAVEGKAYAGPLRKAAEADERSRAAILFGLYQQPAFRSLIGEGSLLNQNIPGVKKKEM